MTALVPVPLGGDPDYDAAWSQDFGAPGVTGAIQKLVIGPENSLQAFGPFAFVSGVLANGAAEWTEAGWGAMMGPDQALSSFDGFQVLDSGAIVAGGTIRSGGSSADGVHIFENGDWRTIPSPFAGDRVVFDALSDEDILAGTCWASSAGFGGRGALRYDGSNWSPVGDLECVATVFRLPNGHTFISGRKSPWGALESIHINDGVILDRAALLRQVITLPDGEIYGVFAASGTHGTSDHVARWNGATWDPLPGERDVRQLFVHSDGTLLARRWASSDTAIWIEAWDGGSWSTWYSDASDPLFTGAVRTLIHHPTLGLVAAGPFNLRTDPSVSDIASWQNEQWVALAEGGFGQGGGVNGRVQTMHLGTQGIYVAGDFTEAGGVPAAGLAVLGQDGWTTLDGAGGHGGSDILETPDGSVWVAGAFIDPATGERTGVRRWNGADWEIPGGGLTAGDTWRDGYGTAGSIALGPDGTIYVGGYFARAGRQDSKRLAAWKDGAWKPLPLPLSPLEDVVHVARMVVCPDGSLLVGVHEPRRPDRGMPLLKWDGVSWSSAGSFVRDSGDYVRIAALSCTDDGIIAGGVFDSVDGVPALNIARFDGSDWSPMGDGFNGGVRQVVHDYAGNPVVSGDFHWSGTTRAVRVARWTGSAWGPLGRGTEFDLPGNTYVLDMISVDAERFYLAGDFDRVGQQAANNIARFDFTKVDSLFLVEPVDPEDPQVPAPEAMALSVYPNPGSSSEAFVRIELPEDNVISIRVFDALGRDKGQLWQNRAVDAGTYELPLSGLNLSNGIFWIRVEGESRSATTSWVMIR